MKVFSIGVVCILACLASLAHAQKGRLPAYEDYPTSAVFTGKQADANLDTAQKRNYRTQIRRISRRFANFAGEFVLGEWGCGTSCLYGAVVNPRTGQVVFLPGSVCCWGGDEDRLQYRTDSRLLIANGRVNEGKKYGRHYYEFTGRKFRLVHFEPLEDTYLKDFKVKMCQGFKDAQEVLKRQRLEGKIGASAVPDLPDVCRQETTQTPSR